MVTSDSARSRGVPGFIPRRKWAGLARAADPVALFSEAGVPGWRESVTDVLAGLGIWKSLDYK